MYTIYIYNIQTICLAVIIAFWYIVFYTVVYFMIYFPSCLYICKLYLLLLKRNYTCSPFYIYLTCDIIKQYQLTTKYDALYREINPIFLKINK